MSKVKTYGRKLLNDLCERANTKGVKVSFHIDQNAKYVIRLGKKRLPMPTAAAACHRVQGMIDIVSIKS
jgi:hypothetical protein